MALGDILPVESRIQHYEPYGRLLSAEKCSRAVGGAVAFFIGEQVADLSSSPTQCGGGAATNQVIMLTV